MKIELLYIEGCPHFTATMNAVKRVLWQFRANHPIVVTKVENQTMAVSIGFPGSPTVRINGLDIEPAARQRTLFGMMCRTYEGRGVPSENLIRSAIVEASDAS